MTKHYYSPEQDTEFIPSDYILRVSGMEFPITTAGGVFSPKKLDNGSKLLIENAIIKSGWKVLDLGCGYGPIGISLKKKNPSIEITFADVNQRALKLVKMNLQKHKLEAEVIQSDIFTSKKFEGLLFDTILLNPPQSAGKDICIKLIKDAKKYLVSGGKIQIVLRHQKGGKHLSSIMEEYYGNLEVTARGSGFRIYVSENK